MNELKFITLLLTGRWNYPLHRIPDAPQITRTTNLQLGHMDISPDKQNVDRVFSGTTYYIDFYQRDYRWNDDPVLRLLDDIFHKFRDAYSKREDLKPSQETITSYYPWYYLNTYVTNVVDGRVYIVDGQQRLTTLSLILIKLRHLAQKYQSVLAGWIEGKIAGQAGYEKKFWMNHVSHQATQTALFEGEDTKEIDTSSGLTAENMVSNYGTISSWLDKELQGKHCFETFVFYFLYRLVLINLAVEQTDVSMVFEVINDRGVRLRPYEILKGKLLGQIDKIELDQDDYNGLWECQAEKINTFREDQLDDFFRFFLKAKFSNTRREGQRFDGDYHRVMFSQDMNEQLGLLHNPGNVKKFLKGDFKYYTGLYLKLLDGYSKDQKNFRALYLSSLLDLDAPFYLSLASCVQNDPFEEHKIRELSKEIDRYFSLLQLQNAYDSNEFADSIFRISNKIRGKGIETYRPAFDGELTAMIAERRNMEHAPPFSYGAFRHTGSNLNRRFKRYFFARIDEFLAENMKLNPKHPIEDLVKKTGTVNGFHVEHILSWNDENKALFKHDEELFDQERNRLGGILLLKGRDNISSNNEPYREKLNSYANTLYWNETLRADAYKSKLDMQDLRERHKLNLHALDQFGPEELESRHRLLFEISKIIWQ